MTIITHCFIMVIVLFVQALIIRVTSPSPGLSLSKVLEKGEPELIQGDRGRGLLFVNRIASQLTASSDGRIIEAIVLLKDSQPHSMTSVTESLYHRPDSALVVQFHEERIDAHNSQELKDYLLKLYGKGTKILILDLGEVRLVDSSGLGPLMAGHKVARLRDARFILVNLTPRVDSMLTFCRLRRVFEIYPSVEDAMNTLSSISTHESKQD